MGKEELEGGFKKGENLYSYRDGISWFSRRFISWREKQCMLYLSIEKAKILWEISLRLHGLFYLSISQREFPYCLFWTKAADKKKETKQKRSI